MATSGTAFIDAPKFREILAQFQVLLSENEQLLNDLNVYPVPDSDTGTNSLQTLKAGLASVSSQKADLGTYALAVASAAANAAMGNSGVILAQYLHGLAQGLSLVETHDQCSQIEWQQSLRLAAKVARESVLTPAEGTMLTVADAAAKISEQSDFVSYCEQVQTAVRSAVIETQDLLPELRSAEVIDAGALALSFFHDSVALSFEIKVSPLQVKPRKQVTSNYLGPKFELMFSVSCTDIMKSEIETLIGSLGESISISGITPNFNFHIHTDDPNLVLERCEDDFEITNIRISELGD